MRKKKNKRLHSSFTRFYSAMIFAQWAYSFVIYLVKNAKKEEDLPHLRLNPLPISMGWRIPLRIVKAAPANKLIITKGERVHAGNKGFLLFQYCLKSR